MLRKKKAFYFILGVFTSVCMTFIGITGNILQQPTIAYAGETTIPEEGVEFTQDHITYKLQADGTLRISTDGQVTALSAWFVQPGTNNVMKPYKDLILKVIFEEGFVSIGGSQATSAIKNVQHVKFPDSCAIIGDYCFYGFSKLETIKFGKNLTSIGNSVFSGTKLTKINFPSTLSKIGYAFNGNGLKTIDLPANVDLSIGTSSNGASFREMPAVSTLIVRGNCTYTSMGSTDTRAIYLKNGVYLNKIVYMADEWSEKLLKDPDQHINSNTIIYCTEANYDSVYEALSSTGANFKKVTGIDDLASSTISDDNVSIDDIINDIEEYTTGDETEIEITGDAATATIRLSIPTEVSFVIAPNTKSKFITKPFTIENQTGAPVKFTLNKLSPASASNDLKLLSRTYHGNDKLDSWVDLNSEETQKGIALNCSFDINNDDVYDEIFWETPITELGDKTEIEFNLSADGKIGAKLGGLYGLAWQEDHSGSYKLKGTVTMD